MSVRTRPLQGPELPAASNSPGSLRMPRPDAGILTNATEDRQGGCRGRQGHGAGWGRSPRVRVPLRQAVSVECPTTTSHGRAGAF